MASRLVVLRQRLANTIHSALERFSEVVAPVISERTGPFLEEGEVLFDFPLLQRMLGRMVEASFERIVAADKAHFDELTNDIAPRIERDRWVATVRRKLPDPRRGDARAPAPTAGDGAKAAAAPGPRLPRPTPDRRHADPPVPRPREPARR